MRWWGLVLVVGLLGCDRLYSQWDCHGAGFMQGCVSGQLTQKYYQHCERYRWGHEIQGYHWLDEEVVRLGAPNYATVFEDNSTCAWDHAVSDNHREMMSIMGMPTQ